MQRPIDLSSFLDYIPIVLSVEGRAHKASRERGKVRSRGALRKRTPGRFRGSANKFTQFAKNKLLCLPALRPVREELAGRRGASLRAHHVRKRGPESHKAAAERRKASALNTARHAFLKKRPLPLQRRGLG